MRQVRIMMLSTDTGKQVDFTMTVERKRGEDSWEKVGDFDVASGTPEADRSILLEDNERIVVEAKGEAMELVYDKEQGAVMPRHAYESRPTPEQRAEMEATRQKELRDGIRGRGHRRELADRAAAQVHEAVMQHDDTKQASPDAHSKPTTLAPSGQQEPQKPVETAKPSTPPSSPKPPMTAAKPATPPVAPAKEVGK